MMATGSTSTVLNDAYPVALTKQGLRAGAFSITKNPGSNHAKLISENHFDDPTQFPLFTLASTVPRRVRSLVREPVTDEGWPVEGEKSFLNFRWPIVSGNSVYLKSADGHLNYSREQYDLTLRHQYPVFVEFLLRRLNNNYDPKHVIELGVQDIVAYTQERIQVVSEGELFCRSHDCSRGTQNWEDWSTPSRDKKLKEKFSNFDALIGLFEENSPGILEQWRRAQVDTKVTILGYNLSLKTIRYLLESGKASSDPNVSTTQRWGLDIDNLGQALVSSTIHLLEKRKSIIAKQNQSCSPDTCFAKTANWLAWNTYKTDEELLKNYQDFKQLCVLYGTDSCFDLIFSNSDIFDSGVETLALRQWVDRIPLFHSDPTVPLRRRWGSVADTYLRTQIDFELDVTFSDKNIALVDSKRLIDLPTGGTLLMVDGNTKLMLSKSGTLLRQNGDQDTSFEVGERQTSGVFRFKSLDTFTQVSGMSWNVTHFFSSQDIIAVVLSSQDKSYSFAVVFDGQGKKLIDPVVCNLSANSDLIFIPSLMKLISTENNLILDISKQSIAALQTMKIDASLLYPIYISSDKQLFNYHDETFGVDYPLYLKKGSVTTLGLDNRKNVSLSLIHI